MALQLPRHINEMTLPLNNPDFTKVILTKNNVCWIMSRGVDIQGVGLFIV